MKSYYPSKGIPHHNVYGKRKSDSRYGAKYRPCQKRCLYIRPHNFFPAVMNFIKNSLDYQSKKIPCIYVAVILMHGGRGVQSRLGG
jgi:hypothetical protein